MDYMMYPYYRQSPATNYQPFILDQKRADVDGDGNVENVTLTGVKAGGPDSIVISDIRVNIDDGQMRLKHHIDLKINKGYNPKLFLGHFSNSQADDILVSIDSGNTGREGYFYIYSFLNNVPRKLFDFEEFNNKYKYNVVYKNNYIVLVTSKFNDKQYTIDISHRNSNYLSALYNKDGTLKKPLEGYVSPITELHPVVSESNNGYDIYALQRVVGYYNADTLGMMITPLRWNGANFNIIDNNQYLTIFETNK
jgi:hypothetical protein